MFPPSVSIQRKKEEFHHSVRKYKTVKIPLDLTLPDKVIRTTRHEAVTIAVLNIIVAREEVLFLTRSS